DDRIERAVRLLGHRDRKSHRLEERGADAHRLAAGVNDLRELARRIEPRARVFDAREPVEGAVDGGVARLERVLVADDFNGNQGAHRDSGTRVGAALHCPAALESAWSTA